MKAFVFPGQGSQFPGMAKDLYENFALAKEIVDEADQILGFSLSKVMFEGTDEDLKQTKVTQPAIYLHSVLVAKLGKGFAPDMVAGHSLGEFSALVAAGGLSWQDGLRLVYQRALAMQKACEIVPSTMAAVLGLADSDIERICGELEGEVVAANYNCPGQVVISGSVSGIEKAAELLKAAGAKRVLTLPVGGAFHSPFMEPARVELAAAIEATTIERPICPIFQNVTAKPSQDPVEIKQNLIAQLTGAVRWTQSVEAMVSAGATDFIECGPGKVLQGLVKKISADVQVASMELA
ncbi:ACP S-malonyltransferase [Aquirufa nivalisilvae]|uniref:Malonyl CoA-acyl carrier protein transacylase n=1 Tax=Aquirufa nivalisilvae TaxID=2516557 RepID=A0A2S2DU01_9BACT|nr:ACP S-malonyltransferase [Aquirufa nivalisilvae]AWL08772.1 [Acyl-carrier-protein] S-malonyltransferase [Aquirufa nivalisilvae]MCZ2479244.1 ACP S-malonyltransferase [Aquirufa nivalisilvae]MCZ2483075.1 ACP S-malonyltransferase [Aquirufa nivalisilvae]